MTRKEYEITSIDLDIYELTNYRLNLKRFALLESRKNTILAKKFYGIFDEIDRVTINIYELEKRKYEIFMQNAY